MVNLFNVAEKDCVEFFGKTSPDFQLRPCLLIFKSLVPFNFFVDEPRKLSCDVNPSQYFFL